MYGKKNPVVHVDVCKVDKFLVKQHVRDITSIYTSTLYHNDIQAVSIPYS